MHNNQQIKNLIIESCINFTPEKIIPLLKNKKIKTSTTNYTLFYSLYEQMISNTKHISKGKLSLKIEQCSVDNESLLYNFYDEIHPYARLTLVLKESKNLIELDILPF